MVGAASVFLDVPAHLTRINANAACPAYSCGRLGEGQAGDPYRTTWDDRSCRSGSGRHRRATRGAYLGHVVGF